MKRQLVKLSIVKKKVVPLPELPREVLSQILSLVPHDDTETLWSLLQTAKAWQSYMLALLAPILHRTRGAMLYVLYPGEEPVARFEPELERQVGKWIKKNLSSLVKDQLFFHLAHCEQNHTNVSSLLAVLNYIQLTEKHLYSHDSKFRRALFMECFPEELVRLRHVFYLGRDQRAISLLTRDIQVVRDMPEGKREQEVAIVKRIRKEKDPTTKKLLSFYNDHKRAAARPSFLQGGGISQSAERRAKCFLLTEGRRKIREARSDDCFNDVLVSVEGSYVHIYSEEAKKFRTRCFNFTGSPEDLAKACGLLRNLKGNRERIFQMPGFSSPSVSSVIDLTLL